MGLFDLFKSPEQKKLQERIDTINKEIFPGGKKQQEQEVQEVRQLLGFKYTKEAVEYAFVFAAISYHTSEHPKNQEIVAAVLRNTKTSVSREDAEKICLYVENKRYYKPTGSLGTTLQKKSDGDKLFMVAFGGIVEIKRAYKDLTNFGKFEVLLFNSLIALQEFQPNYPDRFEAMKDDFYRNIFKQARVYNIQMTEMELAKFVNSRFETYLLELFNFEEETGYLLLKIYSLFYEQPLNPNPETSFDLFEYAAFLPALMQMRNYIIEKTFTTL